MLPRPGAREIDREARLQLPAVEVRTQPPAERVRNFDEVILPWTGEMAMAEASRCLQCASRPCVEACPLHNDIPAALWLTEHGDFDGAAQLFRRTNNFSDVCSRVCPQERQCQAACPHLKDGKAPVAVGRIESFLADRLRKSGRWPSVRPPCSGHRVAVVGAGPAGLTVAELLGREGHCVTVFDEWPDGGGGLRYGTPRFKLDHGLVQARLDCLRTLGVEFVFDTRVANGAGVDALFSSGFEAVFLGTGAGVPVRPGIPGEGLEGVHLAKEFLVRANVEQNLRPSDLDEPPRVGARVAVLGGGDLALDCSRTALRLGAVEVACYFEGTETEMKGTFRDRALAREEGVITEFRAAPLRIVDDGKGRVRGLELARVAPRGSSGTERWGGEPSGTRFQVPADTVVLAFGLAPDPTLAQETRGLTADPTGRLLVDPATGRTEREMVWAGGGNVLGPGPIAGAVLQARIAARDIHARLSWRADA